MAIVRTDFLGNFLMYRHPRAMFLRNIPTHVLIHLLAFLLSNFVTISLGHRVAGLLGGTLAVLKWNRDTALFRHLLAFLVGDLMAGLLWLLMTAFPRDLVTSFLGNLVTAFLW